MEFSITTNHQSRKGSGILNLQILMAF